MVLTRSTTVARSSTVEVIRDMFKRGIAAADQFVNALTECEKAVDEMTCPNREQMNTYHETAHIDAGCWIIVEFTLHCAYTDIDGHYIKSVASGFVWLALQRTFVLFRLKRSQ